MLTSPNGYSWPFHSLSNIRLMRGAKKRRLARAFARELLEAGRFAALASHAGRPFLGRPCPPSSRSLG